MEGAANGPADKAHDDGQDYRNEDSQHGVDVEELLHLARVLVVKAEDQQQSSEEEDLRHQRLDDALLIADEQGEYQDENDDDVDDHCVSPPKLATLWASRRRKFTIRGIPYTAAIVEARPPKPSRWADPGRLGLDSHHSWPERSL